MAIQIPEVVNEYCKQFKMCAGCKFHCEAPVLDSRFDEWAEKMSLAVQHEVVKTKVVHCWEGGTKITCDCQDCGSTLIQFEG